MKDIIHDYLEQHEIPQLIWKNETKMHLQGLDNLDFHHYLYHNQQLKQNDQNYWERSEN